MLGFASQFQLFLVFRNTRIRTITSNTLLDILIEIHNRTKNNLQGNIKNSHQFIHNNTPNKLIAANILQVTNNVGSNTNKCRALRRFKPFKHRNKTPHTPSNSSTIPISSISTPVNAVKNTTNSMTPAILTPSKLTPLMSCVYQQILILKLTPLGHLIQIHALHLPPSYNSRLYISLWLPGYTSLDVYSKQKEEVSMKNKLT